MSNFQNANVHFGEVKGGQSITIDFIKNPDADTVVRSVPQCGCTTPIDFPDRIKTTYHAAKSSGTYSSTKRITVTFQRKDGSVYEENLILTGQVVV